MAQVSDMALTCVKLIVSQFICKHNNGCSGIIETFTLTPLGKKKISGKLTNLPWSIKRPGVTTNVIITRLIAPVNLTTYKRTENIDYSLILIILLRCQHLHIFRSFLIFFLSKEKRYLSTSKSNYCKTFLTVILYIL